MGPSNSKDNANGQNAQSSHPGVIVFVVLMMIILSALVAYVYYRKKKRENTPVANATNDTKHSER